MMIAHFCVKKTFLSHLYENVANHDFDRFRPRKFFFVKISSICYQKRKWNIKHKRFIEQSISYHIGWSTLRSKVLKIAIWKCSLNVFVIVFVFVFVFVIVFWSGQARSCFLMPPIDFARFRFGLECWKALNPTQSICHNSE